MTIQEAIQSGRPFRRKFTTGTPSKRLMFNGPTGATEWLERWMLDGWTSVLRLEDILATDWEIKQETLEFTLETGDLPMRKLRQVLHEANCTLDGQKVKVTIEVIE